jgi:hypothetical protein
MGKASSRKRSLWRGPVLDLEELKERLAPTPAAGPVAGAAPTESAVQLAPQQAAAVLRPPPSI